MPHVFVVDENTLPIHLKYKFAGTGAKENKCEQLTDYKKKMNGGVEKTLTSMIADISRVREGDSVLFYLQQTKKHEGTFFGSFKVVGKPFLDNDNFPDNKNENEKLGKKLTFRVQLKPDEVYKEGITERECIDSLEGIKHPSQMCWSLIYRKLKANRGCTMITDYEYKRIMEKIKNKKENKNGAIKLDNFTYNKDENIIVPSSESFEYTGKKESLDVTKRLIHKKKNGNKYEVYLQAYILQNLSKITDCLKINNDEITWIGNEVSCGAGMQSIDICFIQENSKEVNIYVCELKAEQPGKSIKEQLEKYLEWMKDYIVPTYNKKVILHPIIIAPKAEENTKKKVKEIKNSLINNSGNPEIKRIRYVGYEIKTEEIVFMEECND